MEGKIFQKITAAMADIGAVTKNTKNQQQGFMYRGIDAVMNAMNPVLQKHHLFVVPEVLDQTREERQTSKGGNLIYSILRMKYSVYAEDGSSVSAIVIGEGMDSGDKASNKAMSVAYKYAMFQIFSIPTEEMKDPDAEVHDVKPLTAEEEEAQFGGLTEKQVALIRKLCTPDEEAALCKKYGIGSIEELPRYKASTLISMLMERKEKR